MKYLMFVITMSLLSINAFAGRQLDYQIEKYDACKLTVEAFYKERIKAGREDFTFPYVAPICVAASEGRIDLDSTLAMLDQFATNSLALEVGEAVKAGVLSKTVLLRLLANPKMIGPTPRQIAYEITPLIASGLVMEDCFEVNHQIRALDDALEYCSK